MELANVSHTTGYLWSQLVKAISEINAKEVDQVGMKWKSPKEFGTQLPEMKFFHLQSLIHYTGETTMHKLISMMNEKERCNHRAHYSRQHMFMPDISSSWEPFLILNSFIKIPTNFIQVP